MTNPNPVNVAASIRQRLKNVADRTGRPFAEVLQWYAIERFIARFVKTEHSGELLLKGAALLRAMEADPARPTMDIDFGIGRTLTVEQATSVVFDCLAHEVEPDGLSDLVTRSEDKNRQWAAFVRRMRFSEPVETFEDALVVIRTFAMPVFAAIDHGEKFEGRWRPVLGWQA